MIATDIRLRANYSSAYAPPRLTNVTIQSQENKYTYDVDTLWVAYGIAVLFASLATLLGLLTIWRSKASYSHRFSTIVRVARTADLSEEVRSDDKSGQDPLPEYLKRAHLDLRDHETISHQRAVVAGKEGISERHGLIVTGEQT